MTNWATFVCEACVSWAVVEEGVPEDIAEDIMRDIGDIVSDHDCDQLATDGRILCRCACHPGSKRMAPIVRSDPWSCSWHGKAKDLTSDVVENAYQQRHG